MSSIIQFLGYDPLPAAKTWLSNWSAKRTTLGLSQKESAERLGVDPGTLARWKQGKRRACRGASGAGEAIPR